MKKYKTSYLIKVWTRAFPRTFIEAGNFLITNKYPHLKQQWRNITKYTFIIFFIIILLSSFFGENANFFGYPKDDFFSFVFIMLCIIGITYGTYIFYIIWKTNFKKKLEEDENTRNKQ